MPLTNQSTRALKPQRSRRMQRTRLMSSFQTGKFVPLDAFPLLRMDGVESGQHNFSFQMAETAETLDTAVNLRVQCHFISHLAAERFENSLDALNRAYKKELPYEGAAQPTEFYRTSTYVTAADFYEHMGIHAVEGQQVNGSYLESYNILWNFLARNRSQKITPRNEYTAGSLAPAFWPLSGVSHLVPEFDQALIDGEVPLNVVDGQLPVRGIGMLEPLTNPPVTGIAMRDTQGVYTPAGISGIGDYGGPAPGEGTNKATMAMDIVTHLPTIFAELQENGITVSLSNIDMAKKTAAFARMRQRYEGIDEDWMIDMLMSGIQIPDAQMAQPMLLATQSTIFGYNKRYATDSGNLDKSATDGMANISLRYRMPPTNTGGIVLFTAQATPEKIWERKKDYFLYNTDPDKNPEYVRDYLDPEKVVKVSNDHLDVKHTVPDGTFAYSALNHEWMRDDVRIGGKYFRPDPNAPYDENRASIWACETVDPYLTADWYLCTDINQSVFADTLADPFEVTGRGNAVISGHTVFGARLNESSGQYDEVMSQVDQTRIDQTPVDAATATTSEEPE